MNRKKLHKRTDKKGPERKQREIRLNQLKYKMNDITEDYIYVKNRRKTKELETKKITKPKNSINIRMT